LYALQLLKVELGDEELEVEVGEKLDVFGSNSSFSHSSFFVTSVVK